MLTGTASRNLSNMNHKLVLIFIKANVLKAVENKISYNFIILFVDSFSFSETLDKDYETPKHQNY